MTSKGLWAGNTGLWAGFSGLSEGGGLWGQFAPNALFSAGEPGVWYDPSDLTTLFQDTAGTTPVTSPGQTVALMLDKSRGAPGALGPELVTNGDFSQGATGWTLGANIAVSGGQSVWSATTNSALSQSGGITQNRWYEIEYDVTSYTSGSVRFGFIGGSANLDAIVSTAGKRTAYLFSGDNTSFYIIANFSSGFVGSIDNISVRELPGFHATQSNLAQRPTYGVVPATGRRNLLTWTEDFGNVAWGKTAVGTATAPVVTANADTAPDGTMTADLVVFNRGAGTSSDRSVLSQSPTLPAGTYTQSVWLKAATAGDIGKQLALRNVAGAAYLVVTLSGAWARYDRTEVWAANNWEIANRQGVTADVTVSALIWGAQLETGSTATAYQRVTTAFDVTEQNVPTMHYLSFDGTDDGMLTGNIVPGTDKAQVWAGVRKLSDAAAGMVAELSVNATTRPGTFQLRAPLSVSDTYFFSSSGSVLGGQITVSGFASPITNVLTGIGDIANDAAIFRVDGTQIASVTTDQGTGNYLTYPLYIGRRGGTSLPFNGQLYGLIVRFGTNLPIATIQQTERYIGQRVAPTVTI